MAQRIAVDGATFDVAAGEIFGLLGPNGAGKTTTILMLLGLSDISAGEARVFGHDPDARAAWRSSAWSAICRTRSASTTISPPPKICITRRG